MDASYNYLLKFLVIGDANTGKSCLLHQFLEGKFRKETTHTIGVEFGSKTMRLGSKAIKLQIWDTAGQERFRSVTKSYYRGAAGMLLVFDIANRDSFNSLHHWLIEARSYGNVDMQILLVGNKSDLEETREVSFLEASTFALENDITFLETSALNGNNVNEAFLSLAKRIITGLVSGVVNTVDGSGENDDTDNEDELTWDYSISGEVEHSDMNTKTNVTLRVCDSDGDYMRTDRRLRRKCAAGCSR